MSVSLHGARVFKALIVVHATLQGGTSETSAVDEKAREEFEFWMETIVHDVKYQPQGERGLLFYSPWNENTSDALKGYGKLAALYATYLRSKLCLSIPATPRSTQNCSTWENLYQSTVALREALLSSIQEHSVNGARCMALRLVLQDCLQIDRRLAIDGEGLAKELADRMKSLSVVARRYEDVDGLEKCGEWETNIRNSGKIS